MSRREPRLVDVIICDEVRQEITGKLIIVGMYLDNIGVPELPFVLPSLTFLCKWGLDGGCLPAGELEVVAPSHLVVRRAQLTPSDVAPDAELTLIPVQFRPFTVSESGHHRLLYRPEGGRARTIAHFDVHCRVIESS